MTSSTNPPSASVPTPGGGQLRVNVETNEQMCNKQFTVGLGAGSLASGLTAYVLGKALEANSPNWNQMSKNARTGMGVALIGIGAYIGGRYFENRCRREHGLPTK